MRKAVESMPPRGLEKMISLRYMNDYTELDIREELCITKRVLTDTKLKIKNILTQVGFGDNSNGTA